MSRLATENKAGRATKGNAHRKRKMAEALPPTTNGVGIAKLNPNSKTLQPLSMGQPQSNVAPGSQLQQPSFQGSLVSANQPVSFVRSNSQLPPGLPSMHAKKRFKVESAATVNAPGVSFQSGSKQALGAKQAGPIKQSSGSRQSSEDAQTHTDGSSKPAASRHPSSLPADSVDSAAVHGIAAAGAAPQTQQATQGPEEQQVAFPFRIVTAKAAQPAGSSRCIGNTLVTRTAAAAEQPAAPKPAMPTAASSRAPASAVSASMAKPGDTQAAASVGGENCMDALAEAAAAASEGSAASSSSHTDDDKDAAEILRDLHNSAGLPQNISPDAGWHYSSFSTSGAACCNTLRLHAAMPCLLPFA